MKNHIYILVTLSVLGFYNAFSNNFDPNNSKTNYHDNNDTLLVLCDTVINSNKIYVNREFLYRCDSIGINQKGLFIKEFTMSAISLGQSSSLKSNGCKITEEMKQGLINEQNNFKFIYIKNIILQTTDGRVLEPSTKNIKVVFLN